MKYPDAIKKYPLSMQIFVKLISNRIDAGKNALIPIVGQTGSGKSLSAEELTKAVYLYRNGEEPSDEYLLSHTFFRAKPFMEAMKQVSDELVENKGNWKKGEAWLWDEVGVEAGHKEFMSVRNRIIGWLIQTFRNQQQIVFFTTPSITFIDASVRKMLHYLLEVQYINKKDKVCVIKPLKLQYNARMDKMYYHNLEYPSGIEGEGVLTIEMLGVPKPSDAFEKKYEQKKNEFTSNLNEQILDMLIKLDKDNQPIIKKQLHREIYKLYHSGFKKQRVIAEKLGRTASTISKVMQTMDREYFDWRIHPNLLENVGFKVKIIKNEQDGVNLRELEVLQ